jgi:hypothetical protein
MDHTALLVEVPNALGNLEDDVSGQLLRKVGEFDNLVEEFATFQD